MLPCGVDLAPLLFCEMVNLGCGTVILANAREMSRIL